MPIKSNRKKAETSNPVVQFYLAEDVRQELNAKVSAIGLYPDRVLLLPLPEDIPEPTESAPLLVRSLVFLFNVSKFSEASTISIDIQSGGTRKPFVAPQEHPAVDLGQSINILCVMQPCAITSFGEKTLILKVKELEFPFNFEIRRATAPSSIGVMQLPSVAVPTPQSLPTTLRKKVTKAK